MKTYMRYSSSVFRYLNIHANFQINLSLYCLFVLLVKGMIENSKEWCNYGIKYIKFREYEIERAI